MGTTTGDAGLTTFHPGAERRSERIVSLDIARGIIMVLMAIDHVRVYAGVPAGGPTFGVFFTRWVTHFAAPGFAFLAGTGAFLYGRKIGVLIVVGQSAFGPIGNALPSAIGNFLYLGDQVRLGPNGPPIDVLYVIVPWIGVMAAGYGFGEVMTLDLARRRKWCLALGLGMTALFVVVAGILVATQPARENAPPALFRMLNQRKYPASVLFLLMTLGPLLAFVPIAETMRGRVASLFTTYGRVPLFFYLLHIPLIHASALVVSLLREGRVDPWLFGNHPLEPPPVPPAYRWSLPLLYLVFALVIALLYIPCKWYGDVKRRDKTGLLRYI
jgi:uncharacterized membrane protein